MKVRPCPPHSLENSLGAEEETAPGSDLNCDQKADCRKDDVAETLSDAISTGEQEPWGRGEKQPPVAKESRLPGASGLF